MIKLNFDIKSFYYDKGDPNLKYKEYKLSKNVDEKLTLNDVAQRLLEEYKIGSREFENVGVPNIDEILWKKYFPIGICNRIDQPYNIYLETSIGDLEKQFEISTITLPIGINMEGMGKTGGIVDGVKFYFHHNESDIHHVSHIHCSYSGEEISVEIETLKVTGNPFKKTKMDVVFEVITEHQQELLNYWNKAVVNGESIPFKLEL